MLRLGKVIKVNVDAHTVDVLFEQGGGIAYGCHVLTDMASTNTGNVSLPVLKTVAEKKGTVIDQRGQTKQQENVYKYENQSAKNVDLEDPTTNYVYAIVARYDQNHGQTSWVCLGFLFPSRCQMLFDPKNIDPSLPEPVKAAIRKLAGATISRTNSDVYTITDVDGNYEWCHPNGSFFRVAEGPTQEADGMVHVDLSKGNRKAKVNGKSTNMAWNTQLKQGADGKFNKDRKVYAQFEVVTEQGTIMFQVNKTTGDIVINTPKDVSNASKTNNKLTIVAGGDATIQSVAGDVKIQSVKGQVVVEAQSQVTVQTDSAKSNSILLAPNASQLDNLLLYRKVAQKFNNHKHTCAKEGQKCSAPDQQIEDSDATSVTRAG